MMGEHALFEGVVRGTLLEKLIHDDRIKNGLCSVQMDKNSTPSLDVVDGGFFCAGQDP